MAKRDVELIIRARNEAKKALDQLNGQLDKLEVNSDAAKSAFQGVSAAADTAAAAFARQEAELRESQALYTSLNSQLAQARAAQQRLAVQVSTTAQAEQRRLAMLQGAQAAEQALTKDIARRSTLIEQQKRALDQSRISLQQTASAANAASASFAKLQQRMAVQGVQSFARAVGTVAPRMNAVTVAAREQAEAIERTVIASRTALSFYQRLRGQLLSLAAAYTGFFQVIERIQMAVDAFRTLEAAQNRLGAIFNQDETAVASQLSFLSEEARRLGIDFGTLSLQYSKFAIAAKTANFENEALRRIFVSVTEAARVNKLSIEQVEGVLLALEQMISKGKVSSEELRRQLGDRLPGAFAIMAAALGKTTAELDAAMQKGEVFANQDTLLAFANELTKRFGSQLPQALESFTTEMGRLGNTSFQTSLQIARGGFIDALHELFRTINEGTSRPEAIVFFRNIGHVLGQLIGVVQFAVENLRSLSIILGAFIGFKVSAVVAAWIVRIGAFATSLRAAAGAAAFARGMVGTLGATASTAAGGVSVLTGAVSRLTAALRFLMSGTGIGLAITAIGAGLAWWATKIDEADVALAQHEQTVESIQAAYLKANGDVEKFRQTVTRVSLKEAQASIDALRKKFEDNITAMRDSWNESFGAAAAFRAIGDFGAGRGGVTQGMVDLRNELVELTRAAEEGTRPLAEINARLVEIEASLPHGPFRDFVRELQDATTKAQKNQEELRRAELVMKALYGTATEAAAALRELAGAMDDANKASINVSTSTEAFDKAIKTLTTGLKEFDKARALSEVKEAFETARAEAIKLGKTQEELDAIEGYYLRRVEAVNAQFADRPKTIRKTVSEGQKALEQQQKVLENLRFEIEQQSRSELQKKIANNLRQAGVDLETQMGQAIAEATTKLHELEQAARAHEDAEKRINDLMALRQTLMEQIQFYYDTGNASAAEALQAQLRDVNAELEAAIPKAIELAKAVGDVNMVANLERIQQQIKSTGQQSEITGKRINEMMASGLTDMFDMFAESVANGKNAIKALWSAFRQFASDFLRQIAQMILQQAIFNALSGGAATGGSGGVGGAIAGVIAGLFHSGGEVGRGGPTRRVSMAAYRGAMRYHEGGFAGFKPGEVPAILKVGEEVLTEDDPRNARNGGGRGTPVKIVNAFDAGGFLSAGLGTREGEQAIMNFVRANKQAFKSIIAP